MTEVLDKPARAKKPKVETYSVEGRTVTLTQVSVDVERSYHGGPEPAQRSKWEVRLDGVLVGFAFYPKGVGKPWVVTSLAPLSVTHPHRFHSGDGPEYVHAWEPPEGSNSDGAGRYARFGGLKGLLTTLTPTRGDLDPSTSDQWKAAPADRWRWKDRAEIAQWVPRFAAAGRMPDKDGVLSAIEGEKRRRAAAAVEKKRKDAEAAARAEQWKAEMAQQKAEAEQLRRDTLEGLTAIQHRLGEQLTNFEAAALAEAIKNAGG